MGFESNRLFTPVIRANVLTMSDIDQRILELAKREYGEDCELERRSEWSYSFKCGSKSYSRISRFMVEPGFQVSASDIRQRWPSMNESDRLDLASNFYNKETWSENDTQILEIIMSDGNDRIWTSCALAVLKHPDRNRAVEFLIERVQRSDSEHPPLNYMQALGMAGDRRAVPVMRPYYEKYRQAMEQETKTGIPEDVFFGPIPYHAFLSITGDLFKIGGSKEYEDAIRKYLDHPKEQVRWWAENALGMEGPTTAKRNAEYRKKHTKQ
jgi:hypothetical protein